MVSGGRICVGQFAGAHGVRGLVRLRSFTENPETIFDYAPLTGEDGTPVFAITKKSEIKGLFLVAVDGVDDKEAADQLRGDKLYIERSLLPETVEGEYYEADLIGLRAVDEAGKDYGAVLGVFDYGAGVFLEIGETSQTSFMLPFKDAFVPNVDVDASRVTIVVPEDWL